MRSDFATLPMRQPISDGTPKHPLTGTGTLILLALRRDRLRICMWVGWLTLLMTYTPLAFASMYPTSADRMARVTMMKTPAGIIMGGPNFGINETDIGVMVANELMTVMIAAAAIMSILTVIRHTRAEEESGGAELVMSAVVGHQARTYAALIVVGLMNTVLALAMTIALSAAGFDSPTVSESVSESPEPPWFSPVSRRSPPSCGAPPEPPPVSRWHPWQQPS